MVYCPYQPMRTCTHMRAHTHTHTNTPCTPLFSGMVKRVRGVAYSMKVSPQNTNRMVRGWGWPGSLAVLC